MSDDIYVVRGEYEYETNDGRGDYHSWDVSYHKTPEGAQAAIRRIEEATKGFAPYTTWFFEPECLED